MTISHDLEDFVNAPWIILAYLLTYMGRRTLQYHFLGSILLISILGFAVCIAKLSDIYGRRSMLMVSWVLFIGFSLGCASAKDMVAL